MTPHRKIGRRFVADVIDDQAEDNDTDREGPKSHTEDGSLVSFRKSEVGLPVADDIGAETEHK